jgi:hypothetical protein
MSEKPIEQARWDVFFDMKYDDLIAELSALFQPLDSDLSAIAGLITQAYGRGLLTLTDSAALAAVLYTLTVNLANNSSPNGIDEVAVATSTGTEKYMTLNQFVVFVMTAANLYNTVVGTANLSGAPNSIDELVIFTSSGVTKNMTWAQFVLQLLSPGNLNAFILGLANISGTPANSDLFMLATAGSTVKNFTFGQAVAQIVTPANIYNAGVGTSNLSGTPNGIDELMVLTSSGDMKNMLWNQLLAQLAAQFGTAVGTKVCRGTISQAAFGSPTHTEAVNTVGTIGFSRTLAGTYKITSSGLFTVGKTYFNINQQLAYGGDAGLVDYNHVSANEITFVTKNLDLSAPSCNPTDDMLSGTPFILYVDP